MIVVSSLLALIFGFSLGFVFDNTLILVVVDPSDLLSLSPLLRRSSPSERFLLLDDDLLLVSSGTTVFVPVFGVVFLGGTGERPSSTSFFFLRGVTCLSS